MRRATLLLLAAAVLGTAGCGGDDEPPRAGTTSTGTSTAEQEAAVERSKQRERFIAIARRGCKTLRRVKAPLGQRQLAPRRVVGILGRALRVAQRTLGRLRQTGLAKEVTGGRAFLAALEEERDALVQALQVAAGGEGQAAAGRAAERLTRADERLHRAGVAIRFGPDC